MKCSVTDVRLVMVLAALTTRPVYGQASESEQELMKKTEAFADTLSRLAVQGRCEEAIPVAQDAQRYIETATGLDGREHLWLAWLLPGIEGVAKSCETQGKYAQAEALYQQTLALHGRFFGPDDLQTAISLVDLAHLYTLQGRYSEAEPLYHQAMSLHENTVGLAPFILNGAAHDYVMVLQEVGKTAEATQLKTRIILWFQASTPLPTRVSNVEYEALLSTGHIDFDSGVKTSAGPVAFQLGPFSKAPVKQEERDVSSFPPEDLGALKDIPSVSINIRAIPIPNLTFRPDFAEAEIVIEHVWSWNHRDLYHRDSPWEQVPKPVGFSREQGPDHLAGFVTVQLIPGTKEEDIRSVEGVLILRLPISVKELTVDTAQVGNEAAGGGVKVTITAMRVQDDDHYVELSYEGPVDRYVTMAAYDELELPVATISGVDWTGRGRRFATLAQAFKGRVKTIKVFIAPELFERRYPFSLHLPVSHGDQTVTD